MTGTLYIAYYMAGKRIDWVERECDSREIMRELVRIGSRRGLHTSTGQSFSSVECHWRQPGGDFHSQWTLQVN